MNHGCVASHPCLNALPHVSIRTKVIAVVVGLAWGLVPVTGAFGLIIYAGALVMNCQCDMLPVLQHSL
mgnify:CR=1 FL=1